MATGLFVGSFDPITIGHISLVERMFEQGEIDHAIVMARRKLRKPHLLTRSNAKSLVAFSLPVSLRRKVEVRSSRKPFIVVPRASDVCIRGVRNAEDRSYERNVRRNLAVGSLLSGRLPLPFLLLEAKPEFSEVSSTAARKILLAKRPDAVDLGRYVPPNAAAILCAAHGGQIPSDASRRAQFNDRLAVLLRCALRHGIDGADWM